MKDSIPRDVFHLNLGTGQAKLEMYGPARYNFEMAKAYGLNNEILRNNLSHVKEKIGQQIGGIDSDLFNQLFYFYREISFPSVLLFCLALSLLVLIFFWRRMIRNYSLLLIMLLCAYLPLAFKSVVDSQYQMGIALEELTLHEGPSGIFKDMGKLPSGYKILLKNADEGWGLIVYPAYKMGWVNLRNIGIIDI
ncbi:MAG: hypothetical protein HYV97_13105 [Bdellovibrio sp.]|nr:hypothetical protein [Bdellovibrio sp.]